jgi:hypothetical protein
MLALSICLVIGLAQTAMAETPRSQAAEENPAPDNGSFQPRLHADTYRRLATPIRADFWRIPLDEALQRLTESSGVEIELVGRATKAADQLVGLQTADPITLQKGIRSLVGQVRDLQIVLDEKAVRILHTQDVADQYILRTHVLWAASNYSSRLRARFIERVRREIAVHDWERADGPWIVAARSIFAVDVYHNAKVQQQIDDLWQREYADQQEPAAKEAAGDDLVAQIGKRRLTRDEIGAITRRLQEKYPLESLDERLAYERGRLAATPPAIAPDVERRLAADESERTIGNGTITLNNYSIPVNFRVDALKQLHGENVEKFIASFGFGMSRLAQPIWRPSSLQLVRFKSRPLPSAEIDPPSTEKPVSLADHAPPVTAGPGALPALDRLEGLHQSGLSAFLSPVRFGYIQDREHVAGFESHGFDFLPRLAYPRSKKLILAMVDVWPHHSLSDLPPLEGDESTEQWAIRRLELVSLLKHDAPRVYVSDNLPRMEELKERPTRPLDAFETDAIPRLIESEDLVARATTNRIEMVGAIRAAKQCTECHQVQRGQLLGAFTYTLVRDPLVLPATDERANRSEPTLR